MPADPLSDDALEACLAPWLHPTVPITGVVLAVSGGPDSTVLMEAAARAAAAPPLLVVTVDHGLRPGAAMEAASVADRARRLGLPHRTLVWAGDKPQAGLQAAARRARYALIAQAARASGASHVLTAHTLDDQAETVLMRLARGSDIGGLAGMSAQAPLPEHPDLVLGRPFLALPKARLLATCAARAWPFVTDPANADPRFGRTRWRRLMPALAGEGMTAPRLAAFAARAARAEAALAIQVEEARARLSRPAETFDGRALLALPEAIALRLVARLVTEVTGGALPRLHRLERLVLAEMRPALAQARALRRTLGGALITVAPDGSCTFRPAPPRRT